ncbi:hypothetical protein Tco_1431042 [Tanacetum coccineum]
METNSAPSSNEMELTTGTKPNKAILMDLKEHIKMDVERQSVKVKELQDKRILKAFKLSYQEKYEHVGPKSQDHKMIFFNYNITIDEVPILCDDKCEINLTSSPIDYPRTKHIEIKHHFLKDNVAKKHITIEKIPLRENVANILRKPLENDQFRYLKLGLGLMLQEEEEEEKKGQDVIAEYTISD